MTKFINSEMLFHILC